MSFCCARYVRRVKDLNPNPKRRISRWDIARSFSHFCKNPSIWVNILQELKSNHQDWKPTCTWRELWGSTMPLLGDIENSRGFVGNFGFVGALAKSSWVMAVSQPSDGTFMLYSTGAWERFRKISCFFIVKPVIFVLFYLFECCFYLFLLLKTYSWTIWLTQGTWVELDFSCVSSDKWTNNCASEFTVRHYYIISLLFSFICTLIC